MKKLSLILGLILIATSAFSYPFFELTVDGKKMNLKEYDKSVKWKDDCELRMVPYKVVSNKDHFDNAEDIAKYVWSVFFPNARTEEPFPCGWRLDGDITSGGTSSDWKIWGEGDGGGDSCTGFGGPGWWMFDLQVTYLKDSQSGIIRWKHGAWTPPIKLSHSPPIKMSHT